MEQEHSRLNPITARISFPNLDVGLEIEYVDGDQVGVICDVISGSVGRTARVPLGIAGRLVEWSADEPPSNTRNVQAHSSTLGWKSAFYNCEMDQWWWGPSPYQALDDVTHWRELPPVPQGHASAQASDEKKEKDHGNSA
jgi:hypothetical protein